LQVLVNRYGVLTKVARRIRPDVAVVVLNQNAGSSGRCIVTDGEKPFLAVFHLRCKRDDERELAGRLWDEVDGRRPVARLKVKGPSADRRDPRTGDGL